MRDAAAAESGLVIDVIATDIADDTDPREPQTIDTPRAPQAGFARMQEGTAEDWRVIGADFVAFSKKLPDRVMEHLRLLDGDHGGFPIDRLKHPVHTATLAAKAGRDDEYVASASLHAIGHTLGSYNHADLAAAIVKPFVSQENHWIVEQHGIFQG